METINFSIEDNIAKIEVTRPKALNALNGEVMTELNQAIDEVEKQGNVRCLIITGDGEKAFVAGADIKEIDTLTTLTAREFAKKGQGTFRRLEKLPFPVIAAVNGFALGGGLELALACDFIIASGNAKFGLPECTLGLIPGYGGTVRLARKVGPQIAKEMTFSGNFYSAERCFQIGLVSQVVERDQLMEAALKMAGTFAQRAPLALKNIKTSIDRGMDMGVDEALKLEAQLFADLFDTEDRKEGTSAFIEKRTPDFKGK